MRIISNLLTTVDDALFRTLWYADRRVASFVRGTSAIVATVAVCALMGTADEVTFTTIDGTLGMVKMLVCLAVMFAFGRVALTANDVVSNKPKPLPANRMARGSRRG